MEHLEHEEEQLERIREWWNKNGKAVLWGLAAAILAAVAVQSWMSSQRTHLETASAEYSQLLQSMDTERDKASGIAARIISDFDDTAYASLAALLDARLAVEKGDWDKASAQLNWVVDHAADEGLQHIARLRLGRVLLQQAKNDAALALIAAVEPGAFASDYAELRGDIELQLGHQEQARSAYREALAAAGQRNTRLLQMKLDDLAVNVEGVK